MKVCLLLLTLATAALGQLPESPYCELYPLKDAKTYFVIHNEKTPLSHRKRIEKTMNFSDDIKRVKNSDKADFYIDFTDNDWMRARKSDNTEIGRWMLPGESVSRLTFPARAHTTVVSAGKITTARTVITPPRTAAIYTAGDEREGSQILFLLRIGKKVWKRMPNACGQ